MKRKRAFTLTEFMLAIAITTIIGASVAGVSMALSTAYAQSETYGQNVDTGRSVINRLGDYVRKTKLVTCADANNMVLWNNDANGDGVVTKSETVTVSYDPGTKSLYEYRTVYPNSLSQLAKTALDAVALTDLTNLGLVAHILELSPYSQKLLLAADVTSMEFSVDQPAPATRTVRLEFTIGTGDKAVNLRDTVTLRAPSCELVSKAGSIYTLTPQPTGVVAP